MAAAETAQAAKGLAGRAWGVSKWIAKYGTISTGLLVAMSFLDGGSTAMAATFNSMSGTAAAGDFGLGNTLVPMVTEGLVDGANTLTSALQGLSGLLGNAAASIPEATL